MAKNMHVGIFTIPGESTAAIPVTGVGFVPTGLIVRTCAYDSLFIIDGIANASEQGSRGWSFVDASEAVEMVGDNILTSPNLEAHLDSFDADGFTVTPTANTEQDDIIVQYLAFRST